ncbi:hypothetical protein SPRG_07454 [Saprolegnia parasitica CBS 223.65]|uniref:Uncharacterized protein n=1 Tax=Saprolegnia parasitica (strain CBS 223.65) TaxID=695850 RepID=A0A067CDI6_SAPPC|nr:hypothetical protein SPRG_07454 [Saprolegnia parasitica CBS 223.65]KDO27205.1 hypothetical protein SPRG_07454 [Saprolegnia parasitica CBS 223.65]|eukprot:XP_012201983.1 hypothetical protein SPRG_07454 [Saprolegnia parasitica CBS 223.65]
MAGSADLRSYMRETSSSSTRVRAAPAKVEFLRKQSMRPTPKLQPKQRPMHPQAPEAPMPVRWRSANAQTMRLTRSSSLPATCEQQQPEPTTPVQARDDLLQEFATAKQAYKTLQDEWLEKLTLLVARIEKSHGENNATSPDTDAASPTANNAQAYYEAAMARLQRDVDALTVQLQQVRAGRAAELDAQRRQDEEAQRGARQELEGEIQSLMQENRALVLEKASYQRALAEAKLQLQRLDTIEEGPEDTDAIASLQKDNDELRLLLHHANTNMARDEDTIMGLKRQLKTSKSTPRASNQDDASTPVRRAPKTPSPNALVFG